jgi:hypothetical protein
LDTHLSRISEVNSSSSAKDVEDSFALRQTENIPEEAPEKQSGERGSEEVTAPNVSKAKQMGLPLMGTPMGKTIGRAIKRLGTTNLNQAEKNDEDKQRLSKTILNQAEKDDEDKFDDKAEASPGKAQKVGWTYRFTKRFERPELTTPDYNRDSENMVLR